VKITKRQLRRVIRDGLLEEMDPSQTVRVGKDGTEYHPNYEGFIIRKEPSGTWVGMRTDYGRPYRYPNHPTKESLFKIIDRHQKRNFGYPGDDASDPKTRSLYMKDKEYV